MEECPLVAECQTVTANEGTSEDELPLKRARVQTFPAASEKKRPRAARKRVVDTDTSDDEATRMAAGHDTAGKDTGIQEVCTTIHDKLTNRTVYEESVSTEDSDTEVRAPPLAALLKPRLGPCFVDRPELGCVPLVAVA